MMSRVDYAKLAAGYRRSEPAYGRAVSSYQRACYAGWARGLYSTMEVLKRDNPSFNKELFLAAATREPARTAELHRFSTVYEARKGVA